MIHIMLFQAYIEVSIAAIHTSWATAGSTRPPEDSGIVKEDGYRKVMKGKVLFRSSSQTDRPFQHFIINFFIEGISAYDFE
jgi:hypothetical protein